MRDHGQQAVGWGLADVPDLHGRQIVVTGADSGIGFEISRVLAGRGATVIMACRDVASAEAAAARIRADVSSRAAPAAGANAANADLVAAAAMPVTVSAARGSAGRERPSGVGWPSAAVGRAGAAGSSGLAGPTGIGGRRDVAARADVRVQRLDLASLTSVHAAAMQIRAACPRLDLLINNAGVMRPRVSATEDGLDPTLGINYVGHFALTGLLLDRLLATPHSRVITLSSLVYRIGRVRPAARGFVRRDPMWAPGSRAAYPTSKLAMLMFAIELQRRLGAAGAPTIAVAAHPGVARTGLVRELPVVMRAFMTDQMAPVMGWLIQDAQTGALAPIRAAVDPGVRGGDFYGPNGLFGSTGSPVPTRAGRTARNRDLGRLLWAESERITGVRYPLGPPATP
ncbi:SDR family NAD(P)-dependent oxidoreductase [Frankia sp. R82]|nr:SDR family NAD(P)-dependent oxidoreductase [Frankia sp. R82]MCM3883826.1 SDR family NAD(P)-dependent oxidoreductase [Frankia sp. R82]